jgi:hypothetical protein
LLGAHQEKKQKELGIHIKNQRNSYYGNLKGNFDDEKEEG